MLKKTLAAVAFTALASAPVVADTFKPEDAVKYRQSIYQVMAAQTGVMGAIIQEKAEFDAAEINKRAQNIAKVLPMLTETYFPATQNVKASKFKKASWNKLEDVGAKAMALNSALEELLAASSQPNFDLQQARKTVGATMQACKSCHDSHRAK